MKEFDTIAAVATGMVESGISIIRVSGDRALDIVSSIFQGRKGRSLKDIKTYTMRYGHIIDKETDDVLDEVIVSYMKGPKSYTAEDIVEINCHGGIVSTNRVLEEVIKCGARLAEPGEFTKRAFLNGRIDLTQAEAVMDIINAKTELSMKAAVMQSEGRISKEIGNLRERLLEMIAHIEATVDFPEDDLEEITSYEVANELDNLIKDVDKLIKEADEGKILREGLNTVIIGKPNVGKSSLLNALLMEQRAIVTKVPGTTRDVIEEYMNIDGIPIKIIDTAGIRKTEDLVEKIGVEKSKEKIDEADLIILVLDDSRDLEEDDIEIINYIKEKNYIIVLNKSDIGGKINTKVLKDLDLKYFNISAKTGEGLQNIKNYIKELFFRGEIEPKDLMIINTRHKEALIRAIQSLKAAEVALKDTVAIDLASIDIRNAWMSLGEITGDTLEEDIIDKIFSEFCIGK